MSFPETTIRVLITVVILLKWRKTPIIAHSYMSMMVVMVRPFPVSLLSAIEGASEELLICSTNSIIVVMHCIVHLSFPVVLLCHFIQTRKEFCLLWICSSASEETQEEDKLG